MGGWTSPASSDASGTSARWTQPDGRFKDAAGDIWQHRVNNYDWDDDWVFTDSRFDLMHGPDDVLLRFLCETVHPVVRSDPEEVRQLVSFFNEKLAGDGWVLVATEQMSGRLVFEGRRKVGAKHPATALRLPEYQRLRDPQVVEDHLRRIEAGLASDPAAAISTRPPRLLNSCSTPGMRAAAMGRRTRRLRPQNERRRR